MTSASIATSSRSERASGRALRNAARPAARLRIAGARAPRSGRDHGVSAPGAARANQNGIGLSRCACEARIGAALEEVRNVFDAAFVVVFPSRAAGSEETVLRKRDPLNAVLLRDACDTLLL